MHRPAELAEIEGVLEELREVLDDPADEVRRRLRKLVPEYRQEHERQEREKAKVKVDA
jgi:predicted secreted protein